MRPLPDEARSDQAGRRGAARLLAGSLVVSAGLLAFPAPPAGAQAPSSCVYHSAYVDQYAGYWYEAETHVKSGAAGCPHIYALSDGCVDTRIRFYPSSGGSYANGYREVCGGITAPAVATNVLSGTKYRSEATDSRTLFVFD